MVAWITMPAIVRYAHAPIHLHLCVLFMLVATNCFLRREEGQGFSIAGILTVAASVLTSWNGVLLSLEFLAVALAAGDAKTGRVGFAYFFSGVVCAAGILAWYLAAYPKHFEELVGLHGSDALCDLIHRGSDPGFR